MSKFEVMTEPEIHEREYVLRKLRGVIFYENFDAQKLEGQKTVELFIEDIMDYFNADKVKIVGIGDYKEYEKTYQTGDKS